MNRSDLAWLKVFGEALSASAAALLKEDGRVEWEDNDTRISGDTRDRTISFAASITDVSLAIEDEQEWLGYVQKHYPTEVVTVLAPVNPTWISQLRAQIATRVASGAMDTPPGARLDEGGEFITVSVTPKAAVKHAVRDAVRRCLTRGEVPDLTYAQTEGRAALRESREVLTERSMPD